MIYTIHKGNHRPRGWWKQLAIWINKNSISRKICFGSSCRYDLKGDADDMDVNKLFGLGYFWNKKESARFGWNYNNQTQKIDLFAYCHVKGQVYFKKIGDLLIGSQYLMMLNIHDMHYSFSVINRANGDKVGDVTIPKNHTKKFSYALGCYFGGNQTAPHDIKIEIIKV